MGEALIRCAKEHSDLNVVGGIDMGDELTPLLEQADAVIDFSFHEVTRTFAEQCAEAGKAIIIGTTGHTETDRAAIQELATHVSDGMGLELLHGCQHPVLVDTQGN